jgi:SAM-dependent methyltransferase
VLDLACGNGHHTVELSSRGYGVVGFDLSLPQLAVAGDLALMVDWAGKLEGAVLRIAALLHLAQHVLGGRPWAVAVSAETMRRAVTVGRYLIPHARAAFAQMGADSLIEDAEHVVGWLRRNGAATFTRRDLFHGARGRFKTVEKLDRPLELLEAHGFVRARPAPEATGPGRRPSRAYEVSPAALTQITHNTQKYPPESNSADIAYCAGLRPPEPVVEPEPPVEDVLALPEAES